VLNNTNNITKYVVFAIGWVILAFDLLTF